jgi:hypothetical protein
MIANLAPGCAERLNLRLDSGAPKGPADAQKRTLMIKLETYFRKTRESLVNR